VALILKFEKGQLGTDNIFPSSRVEIYRNCAPRPGDEVFVWVSGKDRNAGLQMFGTFLHISPQTLARNQRRRILTVQVSRGRPERQLQNAHLRPYDIRHHPDATGSLRKLCDKLLVYSHNKVAFLDADEAEFLNDCFGIADPASGPPELPEGDPRFVNHQRRERKSRVVLRKKAAAPRPLQYEICQFVFVHHYRNVIDFIECHHLLPLGIGGPRITSDRDLILVCANCHRIIHNYIRRHPDDPNNWVLEGLQQAILLPRPLNGELP
jgi:hypothetical protein